MIDDAASLPARKAGSKRPAKRKEPPSIIGGKPNSSSKGLVQMSLAAAFLSAAPKAGKKEHTAKPQSAEENKATPCTVKDPTGDLASEDESLCKLKVPHPDVQALEAGIGSGDPPTEYSGRAGIETMDLAGLWRFACGASTTTAANLRVERPLRRSSLHHIPRYLTSICFYLSSCMTCGIWFSLFLKGVLVVQEEKCNGESSRCSGEGLPCHQAPSSEPRSMKDQDMVKIKDEPDCTVTDIKNESCILGSAAHDLSEDEEVDAEEGNSFEKEASFFAWIESSICLQVPAR